ncbi:MAG: hypothetical protein M3279_10340 [Actinomycetota bacterium]|nr:hypothetical protein [Actinomycetota bacterium]
MTERLGNGDRQKGVARITLGVVLVVTLIGTGFFTSAVRDASAQGPRPTPTGSETTTGGATSPSPVQPTGTQIQFLNPSKYGSPLFISNKPDSDTLYHLVAWVSDPPPDAVVEFQIQTGSVARRIGTATRVGGATGDTFELYWDLRYPDTGEDVPEGNHVLRAILFSGGGSPSPSVSPTNGSPSPSVSPTNGSPSPTASPSPSPNPTPTERVAIASDDENVTVDRGRETVEILDPPNPGSIGLYDPDFPDDPDAPGNRLPGFTVLVQTSAGADHVRIKYSTSAPGSEPSWTECVNQVTLSYADRTKRIGCTVPEERTPSQITALAAVAVEDVPGSGPSPGGVCQPPVCTPPSQRTEAGDAHRLTANYTADPRDVTIGGDPTAARRTCQELTATVFDQQGKPLWRANVDVHGTGPGEGLQFATTSRTHGSKPPDGGGHEREEPLWNCQTNSNHSSERQGVHQRALQDDRKHIESETNEGTTPAGEFVFALRSEALGTTEVVAWADEDEDDVNDPDTTGAPTDPQDPQATTTITWTQPSPTSPATPASPSDTSPSPSGTSPSATTPTATGTSPSPTQTSPSPSPGPTLNCDPETDSNPVRSSHTILCRVSQPGASPSPGSGPSGVRIHAEATGDNDPDGQNSPNAPDFTCVTGNDGTCTFTHGPGGTGNTNNPGTTLYRAWIDSGNDPQSEADQTEGRDESQQPGQRGPEPDDTDVVEKTWQRAPLDCEPEQDGNPTGSAHTVTCRAATPAGSAAAGVNIDVEATGANNPDGNDNLSDPDFSCTTGNDGSCSITHGPGGTGTTTAQGVTRYRAWIDTDSSNSTAEADPTEGRNEGTEQGAIPESDETDVVEKTWTRTPTALTIEPEGDSASVGTCNAFTITVTGDGQPVSGLLVDVEQRHERSGNQTSNDEPRVAFCTPRASDGPNPSAVDQTQGDLDPPDESPDDPGTSGGETLSPTDAQGRVTIGITVEGTNGSDGTGNVVVTAFFETDDDNDPEAGEPQDSSTKTWVAPEARTIDCEPQNATNPTNTQHTITCTARDRFGAPVEGEGVTFTETGAGDFTSRGTRTNANGQVVAVTTSAEGGSQSITATLDDDLGGSEPGEVDECDRAAGTPAGAPAGACSDTVSKTWVPTATSPTQFGRTISLETQRNRLVFGRNVTLGGTVESEESAPASCSQFVTVNISRDVVGGADEFEPFATEQSDANGAFSHSFRADVSANYIAEVEELAQCESATSDVEPVLVKVKVALRISDSNVPRGKRVRFTIRTAPCPETARDKVLLFRAIEGEFGKVGKKRSNDRCAKSFKRRVRDDSVFQGRWPKQAEEFLAGKSRPKVVRVQNRRR